MNITPHQKNLVIQALSIAGLKYYEHFVELMRLSRIDSGVADNEMTQAGNDIYARSNEFYDLANELKK